MNDIKQIFTHKYLRIVNTIKVDKLYLSKQEKNLLKSVAYNVKCNLNKDERIFAAKKLKQKDLLRCGFIEGGDYEYIDLTSFGRIYIKNNPNLINPINWDKIAALSSLLTLIVSVVALIISLYKP